MRETQLDKIIINATICDTTLIDGRQVKVDVQYERLISFLPLSTKGRVREVSVLLLRRKTPEGLILEAVGTFASLEYKEQQCSSPDANDKQSQDAFVVKIAHETLSRVDASETADNVKVETKNVN